MSFSDPQSLTIGGSTYSLPRTYVGAGPTVYTDATGLVQLTAGSQSGNRTRRTMRANLTKVSADQFKPDINVERSMSCYFVFDIPRFGFSVTEVLDVYKGLTTQAGANTYALVTKLLGGES